MSQMGRTRSLQRCPLHDRFSTNNRHSSANRTAVSCKELTLAEVTAKLGLLIRFDFGLECDLKAGPQQIVRIRKLQPEYYCLRLSLKFITTADITADLWKSFTVGQNERKFKPLGRIGLQAFLAPIVHFISHFPPTHNRLQLLDLLDAPAPGPKSDSAG